MKCKKCRYAKKVSGYRRHYNWQCGLDNGVHSKNGHCKRGEKKMNDMVKDFTNLIEELRKTMKKEKAKFKIEDDEK